MIMKRRWMKSVIVTALNTDITFPWVRRVPRPVLAVGKVAAAPTSRRAAR